MKDRSGSARPGIRKGTFAPQIVGKRQTRWVGFDEKVISLSRRGLTVREIQRGTWSRSTAPGSALI
jgi:transposase-like protein